jgi:hypothetical protein
VQRYAGCGIEFQAIVRDIFTAAKFGQPTVSRTLPTLRSLPKLPDNVWEESTKEALEIAYDGLKKSNRIDSHSLAMESLEQLSCSEHCRLLCAKSILSADSDLLATIIAVIHRTEFSSHTTAMDRVGGLEDCYQMLRREAVNTLANCLESVQRTEEVNEGVMNCLKLLSNYKTLSALLHDVAGASSNPHDAAASFRCLHLLCQCDCNVKEAVLELGIADLLVNAAKCRNTILQEETAQFLQLL